MAESDVPDDHRLAGRTPRSVRPGPPDARPVPAHGPDDEPDDDDGDDQIDAVTRLMGFLRSTD
jgi:hypothetical protein